MSNNNEYEISPVAPQNLQPARHFAASYAGEHVAGTEFVIGAMFVAWGVGTTDILWGLLWGNLLAVLTWGLVCAPWMILMFVAGALAVYPSLQAAATGDVDKTVGFFAVADQFIWRGDKSDLSVWHVAAFAWICNLAMHGAMSDMTLLRFARRFEYGFFSFLGMFIGGSLDVFKKWLWLPTLVYFFSAVLWASKKERPNEIAATLGSSETAR